EKDQTFEYQTKTAEVQQFFPDYSEICAPFSPIFYVSFDQPISVQGILPCIKILTQAFMGGMVLYAPPKLISKEEALSSPQLSKVVKSQLQEAKDGHYMLFTVSRHLPDDTDIVIEIGPKVTKNNYKSYL